MKLLVLSTAIIFGLVACTPDKTSSTTPVSSSATVTVAKVEEQKEELKLIEDIKYITDKLKTVQTLGDVVIYTEDTDPNKLLGRPHQYTGKLNFSDTRYKETKASDFATIEIFQNEQDLEDRYNYVETVTKSTPFLMYQFKHKNLLLRIPHEMAPSQTKEYEAALKQM